jgi:hypothetical protein
MEFLIFAAAALILAIGFPHWKPTGRLASSAGQSRLLGLIGIIGHLAGTAAIGWSSGIGAGVAAFLAIPLVASALYSLIVSPLSRSRSAQTGVSAPRPAGRGVARQH